MPKALLSWQLERVIQWACERTLRLHAWLWYHRPDVKPGGAEQSGFPDLVSFHPCGRLLVIENKSTVGALTDAQAAWIAAASRHADRCSLTQVLVLRPGEEDAIERVAQCSCAEVAR
jgi:hypothetical protein